ncbi:MAG TPA: CRTAC1 family protein [Thermoanaerobaculia bacterium]|nr:CRTAC1 family protein [Thermoanaerobaculia bacterium]
MSPATRERAMRGLWAVVLAGSLVSVAALDRAATRQAAQADAEVALARHGFRLDEVAKEIGIDFVHQVPAFDRRLDHIMPQIAAMGAAVAVADFDRDGWQDLYVTNSGEGSANRLYRNDGDGTFTDVAAEVGLADVNRQGTGVSMGALWGDYDNDGWEDLFLYKYGRPELFRNVEGERFAPVGERIGLPEWANVNAAVWLDFDRDGRLDLFFSGYWREDVDLWHLETTRIMPESFEYAENGGRSYLFRNLGGGRFEEVARELGLVSTRWTLAAAAADLFGSGFPDLFLANDYGVAEMYRNEGGRRFVEVGRETGVGHTPKSGMNAAFGDVFNDGRLAIYRTNISEPGVLVQANDLWVPRQGGAAGIEYENLAGALGVDLGGWSWGAQFGDLNNDGTLDLYLANGYVSAGERTSYWYDFSEIAVGHSRIIGDAANWPAMRGRSLSGYQVSRVWINDGAGRFTEVAREVGVTDTLDGRAVALADLGNRGALDVIVANQKGPLLVYRNTVASGRHWVAFELEGTESNRSAIGARVELHWGGQRQVQLVSGGSGFSAQSQRRLHFGLGESAAVERAVIRWPSGKVQTIEAPAVDRVHRVKEAS